jgi:hypothetical protein
MEIDKNTHLVLDIQKYIKLFDRNKNNLMTCIDYNYISKIICRKMVNNIMNISKIIKDTHISINIDSFDDSGNIVIIGYTLINKNGENSNFYQEYIQFILNSLNINKCTFYNVHINEHTNHNDFINDKFKMKENLFGEIQLDNDNNKVYWVISDVLIEEIDKIHRCVDDKLAVIKKYVSENINIRNKKRRRENEVIEPDSDFKIGSDWVPASKTRNALLQDNCLDYFNLYGINNYNDPPNKKRRISGNTRHRLDDIECNDSFYGFLMNRGIRFEKMIVDKIKEKFPNDWIQIAESYEASSKQKCKETFEAMLRGIPIIFQAIIHNPQNKTYGSADIIVRSDYINKLTIQKILHYDEETIGAPMLKPYNYHYRVIDIKSSLMHMNTDGKTLRNNYNVKPFKGQILIYNEGLGVMQGYTPPTAYILGNGWEYTQSVKGRKQLHKNNDPFDTLGEINFTDSDKQYIDQTNDAIEWYRTVYNSIDMTHNPPCCPELYPNMCNKYDAPYRKVKEQMAEKLDEITSIWFCGPINREQAFDNGVKKWSDPNCNANILGINGALTQSRVDAILNTNRDTSNRIVFPSKIKNNYRNWMSEKILSIYVDFETVSSFLISSDITSKQESNTDYIFMIGIGYINSYGEWIYKNLTVDKLTSKEEIRIIDEYIDYINLLMLKYNDFSPNIYHWSFAERVFFEKANAKHNHRWKQLPLFDFLEVVKNEPITVKGAKDFTLKSVAKAMYKHGLTKTTWKENRIGDGEQAMFHAWKLYTQCSKDDKNPCDTEIMKQIIDYNEVDCKSMYEFIDYLRKHNC